MKQAIAVVTLLFAFTISPFAIHATAAPRQQERQEMIETLSMIAFLSAIINEGHHVFDKENIFSHAEIQAINNRSALINKELNMKFLIVTEPAVIEREAMKGFLLTIRNRFMYLRPATTGGFNQEKYILTTAVLKKTARGGVRLETVEARVSRKGASIHIIKRKRGQLSSLFIYLRGRRVFIPLFKAKV